uniref:Right handed beta helix domain-containing protein n=1 Tax=Craspedostauros australis TaxID=1486917 RepID=A0A7R9WU28_9STRA
MVIRCGPDGKSSNECVFTGGDYHVDATNFLGMDDDIAENVRFEGLTFEDAKRYSVWASMKGDITFKDCIFQDHKTAIVPVLLDYTDPEQPESHLSVTFEQCSFTNNRFFGMGSNTAIVFGNGNQNHLDFRQTTFTNNNMLHNNTLQATRSFLIETLGPLNVEFSCFTDNQLGVSPISVFGNTFTSSENYAVSSSSNIVTSDTQYCSFASVFETLQQFEDFNPVCAQATATSCKSESTDAPTSAPTMEPSEMPTIAPTAVPTRAPTTSPSGAPSSIPTISPTAVPTGAPSATPSNTPSAQPSVGPTATPTSMPTRSPTSTFVFNTEQPTANTDRSINGAEGGDDGSGSNSISMMASAVAMLAAIIGLLL